ncbi:hypothetical protein LEMLEM_LOCUS18909 [Lemmus lemmus]
MVQRVTTKLPSPGQHSKRESTKGQNLCAIFQFISPVNRRHLKETPPLKFPPPIKCPDGNEALSILEEN